MMLILQIRIVSLVEFDCFNTGYVMSWVSSVVDPNTLNLDPDLKFDPI